MIFLLGFLSGLAGGQGSRFMTHNNAKTTILGLSILKQVLLKARCKHGVREQD